MLVDGLSKRFGQVVAVDSMTWSAESGQITTVLGPNGAGKTTTMECLEGVQRPDGGTALVLGTDPWRAPDTHRARVGVMLQDGGMPNQATPLRALAHLAALYADPLPLEPLLTRLGIDRFAGTTLRRLSGGQKQRVALAAALVGCADVIFLDEPTAGLDPHARLDVWDLIREQRDRGAAVIVTTHSFEEAEKLADHVVIIAEGRVVGDGSLAALTVETGGRLEDVYFARTRPSDAHDSGHRDGHRDGHGRRRAGGADR